MRPIGKIITVDDMNKESYYRLPKAFFHNSKYKGMKNESKIAYALLKDLLSLSVRNNWINERREVYVKLSRVKLMSYLNIKGTQKYADVMKELVAKELIVKVPLGLNRVEETYICIPDELDEVYNDEILLEDDTKPEEKDGKENEKEPSNPDKSREFENQTPKGLKIKRPEVLKSNAQRFENQTHTNTNTTNYYSSNSISNINTSKNEKQLVDYINFFEANICGLRKTTKPKFISFANKVDGEFLMSVMEYCIEQSASSYNYFDKAIRGFISDGAQTRSEVNIAVKKHHDGKKSVRKNTTNSKKLKFDNFKQRDYDYERLENQLLGWE